MERRPITPAGCLVFNIRQISMLFAMIIIGYTIGGWIGGEKGAQIGLILGVLIALLLPWRRLQSWLQNRRGKSEGGEN